MLGRCELGGGIGGEELLNYGLILLFLVLSCLFKDRRNEGAGVVRMSQVLVCSHAMPG